MVPNATLSRRLAANLDENMIQVGKGKSQKVREDGIFKLVRGLYGVPENFLEEIDLTKIVRNDGGVNAQLVFTPDKKYIVKVSTSEDWDVMHDILADYHKYLQNHRDSLLPRFLSAFIIDKTKWVAMYNWLQKGFTEYSRDYDLKGTTCSQKTGDRLVRVELDEDKAMKDKTFKDLNFKQNEEHIHLPPDIAEKIEKSVKEDTQFLSDKSLMDYSLIIRVGVAGLCDPTAFNHICPGKHDQLYGAFYQQNNGYAVGVNDKDSLLHIYSFGIIDVLENYDTFKKRLAYLGRKVFSCTGSKERQDTVNNEAYKDRFDKMVKRIFKGDVRSLTPSECDRHTGHAELEAAQVRGAVTHPAKSFIQLANLDVTGSLQGHNRSTEVPESYRRLLSSEQLCAYAGAPSPREVFLWRLLIIVLVIAVLSIMAFACWLRQRLRVSESKLTDKADEMGRQMTYGNLPKEATGGDLTKQNTRNDTMTPQSPLGHQSTIAKNMSTNDSFHSVGYGYGLEMSNLTSIPENSRQMEAQRNWGQVSTGGPQSGGFSHLSSGGHTAQGYGFSHHPSAGPQQNLMRAASAPVSGGYSNTAYPAVAPGAYSTPNLPAGWRTNLS